MNFLAKSVMNIARTCVASSIQGSQSTLTKFCERNYTSGSILSMARVCMTTALQGIAQIRSHTSLSRLHKYGSYKKVRKNNNPFGAGTPFMKGIILKSIIKKPKKPNSANRKCVIVRLTNGKEMTAYVPGIGHNLQEHNIVLCRVGRLQDTPGVKIKCVRGKYDLPHVIKRN
ncbi:40S ribosomal protein S12, mitochondrial [Odontomachus brunneus]|uniref:40S ribosomal protein S12, mitochondrial n=1 Tax=Odontomachus brunneus TaxID=486640 RepID=UPI0013F19127|nr:40S ribosomal protein S12, mitochondrial [Odontomachus brunneus]